MPDRITVTYTLHPTTGPQREHLLDALTGIQAQLPLRNLHWKPSTRTALRTIQEIDVRLVDLGEVGPPREVGGSVMDGALVNICLVACDVGAISSPFICDQCAPIFEYQPKTEWCATRTSTGVSPIRSQFHGGMFSIEVLTLRTAIYTRLQPALSFETGSRSSLRGETSTPL